MDSSGNRLLATLPSDVIASLGDELEPVELRLKETLAHSERPPTHVYFPVSGVASMVNQPEPGEIVEFATVGREGFVGLPQLLGADALPSETFVQVPGRGFRLKSRVFTAFVDRQPAFRALLMRYIVALMVQISQTASCNRLHEVDARCARWLLQTDDRVDGHTFPLTQEFLAQMLGVHRPTVTIAAGMLQKAGLITYRRGIITIADRSGLEEAACPCYRFIVNEYERLLGGRG
jgi:CRP-like cAMP-binding protein